MRLCFILSALFIGVFLSPAPARAGDWYPFYLAYGTGDAELKDGISTNAHYDLKESEKFTDYVLGMPISPGFDFEIGRPLFGDTQLTAKDPARAAIAYGDHTISGLGGGTYQYTLKGVSAGLRYTFPLIDAMQNMRERLAFYTRFGGIYWTAQYKGTASLMLDETPIANGHEEKGNGYYYGLGVKINITKQLGFGMEFTRFENMFGEPLETTTTRIEIRTDVLSPLPER